jgi:hypothetical protein
MNVFALHGRSTPESMGSVYQRCVVVTANQKSGCEIKD